MTTDAKKLSDRKERTDFETEMRALAADDYRTAYHNILRELLESQQKCKALESTAETMQKERATLRAKVNAADGWLEWGEKQSNWVDIMRAIKEARAALDSQSTEAAQK
jgi:hypothetical protein